MSDAPVDTLTSPSQHPEELKLISASDAMEPEGASSVPVETVALSSPNSAGSEEKSTPVAASIVGESQLSEEAQEGQSRARAASVDLGQSTDPASAKEKTPPIELAEVKSDVEVSTERETVRNVETAPETEQQQQQQQEQQETDGVPETSTGESGRQGYGTFDEPETIPTERTVSTSRTENEEAMLFSRQTSHNPELSNWMVFTNLMKASMGTGILAMPMAMRNAGYLVGLPLFAAMASVCVYCVHLLVRSSRTLRQRKRVPTMEYADTAGAAFETSTSQLLQCMAPFVRGFTDIFLAIYMIGTCSVYVLFVKENLKQLIDVSCKDNEWGAIDYLLHLALVLVVLVAIPNLRSLSAVSFIANVTMVVGVGMCMGIIGDQINAAKEPVLLEYNRTVDTWSHVTVYNVTTEPWAGWARMPLFFGTAVFALEGIGVVLTLENQMKDPANFLRRFGVLNIAMIIIFVLYSLMGLLGYFAYGQTTKGSITLNLPPDSSLAFWVRKTVTLSIFLTYPLQFYIPEEILWRWLTVTTQAFLRSGSSQRLMDWAAGQNGVAKQVPRFIFKVLLMFATVGLPLAIPRLGPAISLVGAVCLSMLGLILPTIIHTVTSWEHIYQNIRKWNVWSRMVFHVIIIIIGIVGLISGAYVSLNELKQLKAATE